MSEAALVDDLVARLRPELRELLSAALAYTRSVTEPRTVQHQDRERELWAPVFAATQLDARLERTWSHRAILRASELAEEQRAVAEALARTPGPWFSEQKLPCPAWVKRQWLGIDPPGPLFRLLVDGAPLYHVLRAGRADLATLSPVDYVAACCDLRLMRMDGGGGSLEGPLPDAGAAGGAFGVAFAERLLAMFDGKQPKSERGNLETAPVDLRRAAFLSMVRAGVTIEPRWDALLPLEVWMPLEERRACIAAVPEARREAAVEAALRRVMFPSNQAQVALDVLEEHPFASAAKLAIEQLDDVEDGVAAVERLRAAAARSPAVAKALVPLEKRLAKAPKLRVARRVSPVTRAALDGPREKQLLAANRRYEGKARTLEQLFAATEGDGDAMLPAHTTLLFLEDETGTPTHEAWLTMGDSGSVFKAGTTTVVAQLIQKSLECKQLPLSFALRAALADKPAEAAAPRSPPVGEERS